MSNMVLGNANENKQKNPIPYPQKLIVHGGQIAGSQ